MAKQINEIVTATDTFQSWVDVTNQLVDFCNSDVVSVNTAGGLTTGNGFVNGQFGANILSTSTLRGGNTTTNTLLTIETNTYVSGSKLYIGNSTVNASINSSSVVLYTDNTYLSLSSGVINFGNTLVSSLANLSLISGVNFGLTTLNGVNIAVGNSQTNTVTNSSSYAVNNTSVLSAFNVTINGVVPYVVDSFPITDYRSGQYTISVKDNSTGANAYQVSQLLVAHVTDNAYVTEYGIITTNTSVGSLGVFSANANSSHIKLNFTPSVSNSIVKGSRLLITV